MNYSWRTQTLSCRCLCWLLSWWENCLSVISQSWTGQLTDKRRSSCNVLFCRETHVSLVKQGYQVKGTKVRSLCMQLYFANTDGIGFSGQLLCLTKRNPRNRRNRGGGLPLYLTLPSLKKATLNSQDFRISGVDSSASEGNIYVYKLYTYLLGSLYKGQLYGILAWSINHHTSLLLWAQKSCLWLHHLKLISGILGNIID